MLVMLPKRLVHVHTIIIVAIDTLIIMQVYTRLQKLGVCLSHTTTILAVKKMGINHDKVVQDWRCQLNGEVAPISKRYNFADNDADNDEDHSDEEVISDVVCSYENDLPTDMTISITGDNLDKNVKPRDMRISNQVKSLHLFHSVAPLSRVKTLHFIGVNLVICFRRTFMAKKKDFGT